MTRSCGDCQLCCKLLPMSAEADGYSTAERLVVRGLADAAAFRGMLRDFDKPAGVKCPYQRHRKGCTVYSRRPFGCRAWACLWLSDRAGTGELSRPDRSHYVVDESPDFVTTSEGDKVPIVQVWVDPDFPNAHRDPALRAYLLQRWERDGFAALVRFGAGDTTGVPPTLFLYHDADGWHEKTTNMRVEGQHTAEEKHDAGLRLGRASALERLRAVTGV